MDTPQTTSESNEETKQKRSPWLIIIIILLILMMGCCCIGVFLCRGSARLSEFLPDDFEEIFNDIPGVDSDEDIWNLIEGYIEEPDDLEIVPGLISLDCMGLSGNFEMQVLVGPSEAVGLEPFGIGSIPFTVELDQGVYVVQGEGTIDYEDVLEEEWGTFSVFFDMSGIVDGECTQGDDGGVLDITLEVTGEQVFIVDSLGLQEEYPWSGMHEFDFSFPVQDGAMESGEGWAFILHLD